MVDSDDILRLPDRSLNQFMQNLKQDFLNKKTYLKFMKISSKFIQVCACGQKLCHSYCVTAFVLRKQQIYCSDCYHYYRLYVRGEQLFTGLKSGNLLKLTILSIGWGCLISGWIIADHYMKEIYIKEEIKQAQKTQTVTRSNYQEVIGHNKKVEVIFKTDG